LRSTPVYCFFIQYCKSTRSREQSDPFTPFAKKKSLCPSGRSKKQA
jgi:hypothetical protein